MAAQDTKLRLLYIWQILSEETDEDHILSALDLIAHLERRYDVTADRRSIYSDIDTLKEFGIDIVTVKGADHGYYIAGRDFELAELKVLADSVQVAKFITRKKSEEMIKKLKMEGKSLKSTCATFSGSNLNYDGEVFEGGIKNCMPCKLEKI